MGPKGMSGCLSVDGDGIRLLCVFFGAAMVILEHREAWPENTYRSGVLRSAYVDPQVDMVKVDGVFAPTTYTSHALAAPACHNFHKNRTLPC